MLDEENQTFFREINPLLYELNREICHTNQTPAYPAIIITGPPRCGRTVISQIMAAAMDVGYINNFIAIDMKIIIFMDSRIKESDPL